jgi:hypothetical protein
MKERQLKDVISLKALNIIDKRDKDIMLTAMRKLIEDLDKIDLIFAGISLNPSELLRIRQFINNNKLRARKVIWGLTVSKIKDTNEKEYLEDIEFKNSIMLKEFSE